MQPIAGKSKPSVRTMQLQTTSVSPDASRARIAIALAFGRAAIQMLGTNAGFDEFVLHVDAVCNVDTEHQSLPTLAMFVPVGNDVADQIITVHPIGELVDDIIALPGLDAFQIGIGRGVVDRRHQVLLLDQLGDLRAFDDLASK